jgi:hypothetical protein
VGPQNLVRGQITLQQTSFLYQVADFGNTIITGTPIISGSGVYSHSGGVYTLLKKATVNLDISMVGKTASVQPAILVNGSIVGLSTTPAANWANASYSQVLPAGTTFQFNNSSTNLTGQQFINVTATHVSDNVVLSEDGGTREVRVHARSNSSQFLAGSDDVPFGAFLDTTGSWNGTTFTAPETGRYVFDGNIIFTTAGTRYVLTLLDTGSGFVQSNTASTYTPSVSDIVKFNTTFDLKKGDRVKFRVSVGGSLLPIDYHHYLYISKLSSPQTLAGSETVEATYTANSGQAVVDGAILLFNNKEKDSHNAYNTATGIYTAPLSGTYLIAANVTTNPVSATVGNLLALNIRKTGTASHVGPQDVCQNTTSRTYSASHTKMIYLSRGEQVEIWFFETLPAVNLISNSQFNALNITRVGN